jgi:tripartite-type tricarboxylate transporter receptor subunit TctC
MSEFGVYLLVCNRYAKGISSGPLDRRGLNIAINRVLSSENAAGATFLAFEVTKFAALFDKFVSPRGRRPLRRNDWSHTRIPTATIRSLLSATAKIDLIPPVHKVPLVVKGRHGMPRPTSTKEANMLCVTWRSLMALSIFLGVGLSAPSAVAQDSFYKGKTIRFIVGAPPGGGFDTYSRALTRHLGKHIPGNPTMLVDNMPGAAGLVAANYVYKASRPDGLSVGTFVGGLFMQQMLGLPGIEFNAVKFEYLGVPGQDNFMIGLAKSTGIASVEQWKTSGTVLKLGGVAPGGGTDDIPKLLKVVLGLPLQLVTGYKGTAPVRLAFNAGEVQGACNSIESFKATWRSEMETGQIVIVLQAALKPHPEFPNVPWAYGLAKSDDAKKMIQALARVNGVINRPYVLPPGTPKERVKVLQKAFADTVRDPEFLADANRAKLDLNPLGGEEIEREVKALFAMDSALVKQLKEILK